MFTASSAAGTFTRTVAGTLPGSLALLRQSLRDPVGTQRRLLRDLLRRAARTEWGLRYRFGEMVNASDIVAAYQDRVPLHKYDDFKADVERIRRGEADVIWPGRFRHFAVSSGTASAGKIIPVSEEMLLKNRAYGTALGLNYLNKTGNLDFLLGKHLTLPGRIEEDPKYPGTMIGEVSGLQAEYAPFLFRHVLQAVPNEVAFMPNWEEKLKAIAERTVSMDIRSVVMAPTWGLVFFRELIRVHNERSTRRATFVKDVWPKLQVFISGGVALSSYIDLLRETIGSPGIDFLEAYGASEGFFSFQDVVEEPAMLLHLDNGVYYEFVRMDELRSENPRRFAIGDVEPDVRYAIYVTTCSGLWSYEVGDVVRFTGTSPHKILVVGRTSEMLDKYGEAVFAEEARDALQFACRRTGARVRDFHIAPRNAELGRLPAHQWLIEFEQEPAQLNKFTSALDEYLVDANRHYQIRREARAFDAPEVVSLPDGTFYAWLKSRKGRVSGQTKVPRMSEERSIANGVLELMETKRDSSL